MLKKAAIKIISLYQAMARNTLRPSCRFYPTCSQYTKEAIEKHGLMPGIGYGLIRIFKCNQYFKGGYDPVPIINKGGS